MYPLFFMNKKEIKNKIIKLAKAEQDFRKSIFKPGYTPTDKDFSLLRKMDEESTTFMVRVVEEFGLPTIPLVGKKASLFAWLLVQQSANLDFQKKYLALLKKAGKVDILPEHAVYLEDRILVYEGKPQVYGTQVFKNKTTENWEPYPLASKDDVDNLRETVGLDTLDNCLKSFI